MDFCGGEGKKKTKKKLFEEKWAAAKAKTAKDVKGNFVHCVVCCGPKSRNQAKHIKCSDLALKCFASECPFLDIQASNNTQKFWFCGERCFESVTIPDPDTVILEATAADIVGRFQVQIRRMSTGCSRQDAIQQANIT